MNEQLPLTEVLRALRRPTIAQVKCPDCDGSGETGLYEGDKPEACMRCLGSGTVPAKRYIYTNRAGNKRVDYQYLDDGPWGPDEAQEKSNAG